MIKIDFCLECKGRGDVPNYHKGSETCYDCGGRGWIWMGKRVDGDLWPDVICQNLITPADGLHRNALSKNAHAYLEYVEEQKKIIADAINERTALERKVMAAEKALGELANGGGIQRQY